MGGLGSGCWERDEWTKKIAVVDCRILDVNELARETNCCVGGTGFCSWTDQYGDLLFSVSFSTILDNRLRPFLLLCYRWEDWWGEDSEDVSIAVRLQTTRPNYGGLRWWFTCPLVLDGVPCDRRVGRLYLPPGARYFGCRHCHELVYRQERDPLERADHRIKVLKAQLQRLRRKHGWSKGLK